MTDLLPSGMTRRTMLKATAATTAGAALFSGSAAASTLRQVNFCGCSQLCIIGADPSDYLIWVGYYEDDEWTYAKVTKNLPEGDPKQDGGFCYTVEEAEGELDLDSDNEAKLIAVSDFDGNWVGNPTTCAQKPLEVFVASPPDMSGVPTFSDFINNTGTAPKDLQFGMYGSIDVVRGRCGTPGKDDPSKGNGRGR